jgi:hypothetical protein
VCVNRQLVQYRKGKLTVSTALSDSLNEDIIEGARVSSELKSERYRHNCDK